MNFYLFLGGVASGVALTILYQKGFIKSWFDLAVAKVKGFFAKKDEAK